MKRNTKENIYIAIGWVLVTIVALWLTTGCATSTGTIIRQLARQGEFETIQVVTRRGDKVKVKYREEVFFDD